MPERTIGDSYPPEPVKVVDHNNGNAPIDLAGCTITGKLIGTETANKVALPSGKFEIQSPTANGIVNLVLDGTEITAPDGYALWLLVVKPDTTQFERVHPEIYLFVASPVVS